MRINAGAGHPPSHAGGKYRRTPMRIPPETLVAVADGERHLLLVNRGTAMKPDLDVLDAGGTPVASTVEQGAERPGRIAKGGARRGAVEQTDWARQTKERHAAALAARLNLDELEGRLSALILVADPRTLGELRRHLHEETRGRVIGEIAADLVRATVADITAAIGRA
jgi:protein required for attachment to host cells